MKTLVIHTGGIGDFLLAYPTVAALSEDGPVTLVGNRDRLELAVVGGVAEATHDLAVLDFQSIFAEPSDRFLSFVQPFDRVVVWMNDPDDVIARVFRRAGVVDVHVFPGLPPDTWTRHASDYYRTCLGIPNCGAVMLRVAPSGPPLDVVIHPGSGSTLKNAPMDDLLVWAGALRGAGRRVTWCVGPAERERLSDDDLARLVEAAGDGANPILECNSLVDLARRLAAARLYMGNDSGITHLAAALGVPTVAVFRCTDPVIWAPQGDHVTVVTDSTDPSWLGDILEP
jgi:Glycosyltransferase family 9 (heptosyltransferase)